MKTRILLLFAVPALLLFASCKKDNASKPQLEFTNHVAEGTADGNGEFTLTGRITSAVSLEKVTLTKQGDAEPFLIDAETAKNKNEYEFSYLITGITANTTIIVDVYNQEGGKTSTQFLIKK